MIQLYTREKFQALPGKPNNLKKGLEIYTDNKYPSKLIPSFGSSGNIYLTSQIFSKLKIEIFYVNS